MERDKDYESGCIVFLMLICMIISMCAACNYAKDLKKVKSENKELKRELVIKKDKISDLEKLSESYKWQLEQVPYIIEYGCKGE